MLLPWQLKDMPGVTLPGRHSISSAKICSHWLPPEMQRRFVWQYWEEWCQSRSPGIAANKA